MPVCILFTARVRLLLTIIHKIIQSPGPKPHSAVFRSGAAEGEKNMNRDAKLFIPITTEEKERLKEIAKEKDLNMSQLMRRVINQYLRKYENKD